jgi:pyruvate dehydrogenase E1 component beta subunit
VAPYDVEDARGLLKSCIRDPNPAVCLENEIMYNEEFSVPEEVMGMEFLVPIGKAKIMREGKDCTITCFSKPVKWAL